MALTLKDARYVAELAHLDLTEDELKNFVPQLDAVLQHMHALNELDTAGVEPMAQVTYPAAENPAVRSDQPRKTFGPEEAIANAPEPGPGYFKVPKVVEKE